MPAPTLGIDFGTSNTAASRLVEGRPQVIELEAGHKTLPTAVFLDYAAKRTLFGRDAVAAMIEGRHGRFMRSLKSILGTPLARERRSFLNERLTLLDIIARFLAEVRRRAEGATGAQIDRVVSGRPVHFHSADAGRDRQARVDLEECYHLAGFSEVHFLHEPEAAALAAGPGAGIGLIVDIGGGTSDFTLFRGRAAGIEVLGSHGVRIGGTDFDKALSLAHAMPLFGMGGELRNEIGQGRNAVPPAVFHDLASWEKIAFVYGPQTLRDVRKMARLAVAPERMRRLVSVLEMELGHDVAFAVEAGKIAANVAASGEIDLNQIEKGLKPVVYQGDLLSALWPLADQIGTAAREALIRVGIGPEAVERVIFVGGSSLIGVVDRLMRAMFPAARFEHSEVFTAVVDGLAMAAAARDRSLSPETAASI